jgi:hypothetical protein
MISHITIDNMVANSAVEIARVLKEDLKFLYASRICLFPRFANGVFRYTAYIRVGEWVDCDAAYSVIRAMKDGKRTRALVHRDQLWDISMTDAADICHTDGSDAFENWTTEFATLDSDSDTDYAEYEMDVETIMNAKVGAPDSDFSAY